MKWPNTLTVVRHGESAYNVLKGLKDQDPEYVEFKRAYNRRKKDPETARRLASTLMQKGTFVLGVGEHDTAMTEEGKRQAQKTGQELKSRIALPDVVRVSPYDRTLHTLEYMADGWPALADVRQKEDERLREQEHGVAALYNDWRIFQTLHPEQAELRDLQGSYWYRYPQGESVPDVRQRAREEMTKLTRDHREQNVLLVTHHLFILALRANMEDLDAAGFMNLDDNHKPLNCGVTIYRGHPEQGENGKLLLDTYNQQLY